MPDTPMIDVRSDTVTRPTPRMYAAMADAPTGDDVYGDDPTVNRLQSLSSEMLGFEAALFMASGTQSNLVGLLSHCQRGDEYIVGNAYHTRLNEGGGAAALGGIVPESLPVEADGSISLDLLEASIKPPNVHYARSRLVALENTFHGKVVPQGFVEAACDIAAQAGLARHLDGARLFNAATASNRTAAELAASFDSVSICLSKGLCAPVGSLLLGSAEFIDAARRWRKVTGGGMRQAGVLAACGIVALEHMTLRLAEDHEKARELADRLSGYDELDVDHAAVQTNMVHVRLRSGADEGLAPALRQHGIALSGPGPNLRFVLHNDVAGADVAKLANVLGRYFQSRREAPPRRVVA